MRNKVILVTMLLVKLSAFCQERTLVNILNSSKVEYAPSISSDGNTIFYQSNRDGEYYLYKSKSLENESWSIPIPLESLNQWGRNEDLIGGPSISYDGNRIYFFASYRDGIGSEDIYYSNREGDSWGKPINVGRPINSKKYEGFPSISSDGKSLYFMRLNKKIVNKSNCYTIMVSNKDEKGNWSIPRALPKAINSGCEKFPRIMPDNETLIFSSIREESINESFDLFKSTKLENGTWSKPVPLEFVNTPNYEYFGSISSEGDKIFFISEKDKDYNIFSASIPLEYRPKKVINIQGIISDENLNAVSTNLIVLDKASGKEVVNIQNNAFDGAYTLTLKEGNYELTIKSEGFEVQKHSLEVNKIQNFKSINRNFTLKELKPKVSFNILNSRNLEPVNASIEVSSNNYIIESVGNSFIARYNNDYEIHIKKDGFNSKSITYSTFKLDSSEVNKTILLDPLKPQVHISSRDQITGKLVPVRLLIRDLNSKDLVYKSILKSDTTLALDFESKYKVYAISEGYFFHGNILDLSDINEYQILEYPIDLTPIQIGSKILLNSIYFDFASSEITDKSKQELITVYNFLRNNKNLIVEISAHTDNIGTHQDNISLSEDRARSIIEFLQEKGVPNGVIKGKGYGETLPVASNNSEIGRAKNRRVEFKVLEIR